MGKTPKHITITGDLGSGKSSMATRLTEKYGATRVSTGAVQRELATTLGMTTLELNQRADSDPTIDQQIDGIFASLASREDLLVVDSRMAWHFLPQSFKICLTVDPMVAAKRIWEHQRAGEGYATVEECLTAINARKASERARFWRTYGVRLEDEANYDLVIDTTTLPADDVAALLFAGYDKACA